MTSPPDVSPYASPLGPLPFVGTLGDVLLLRHLREGRGPRIALHAEDASVTYEALAALAARWASLLGEVGVARGDRVLLALEDGPTLVAAFFGALAHGAVAVPVSPALPRADYDAQLAYVAPRVCVAEDALAAELRGSFPASAGSTLLAASALSLSEAHLASPLTAGGDGRDDAVWLMTSGSTGRPRAAVHAHVDFLFSAEHYARQVLGLRSDDVFLGVPKIFFGYGTGMNLIFPLAAGARAVLYRGRPTAELLCELSARHQVTVLALVPRMMARLLEGDVAARRRQLASVRVAVSAGEALPAVLYQRFREAFGFEIIDGIGSAEMFHIYLSQRPGAVVPGRIGELVPGYEARLVRPDGEDAGADEPGRLWVRGGSAARGYASEPALSAEIFRDDGWVVSGDFLSRDAAGVFTYQGRADDMLKVGGIYVSPAEVENVLLTHPGVVECAVAGYADASGLQRARAFVVPREQALLAARAREADAFVAELAAHARRTLPGYKVPDRWDLLSTLPRSDRGKLLRRELPRDPGSR